MRACYPLPQRDKFMSHVFSAAEREAFLAAPRVAVVSIAREARAPLSVPIGYANTACGEVGLWMEAHRPKARALAVAGCFSLCVHDEVLSYRAPHPRRPSLRICVWRDQELYP